MILQTARILVIALLFLAPTPPARAADLVKVPQVSFKETPEKDLIIIEADAPVTYHEVKSPGSLIVDLLHAEFTGPENVKLVLSKTVKLVRSLNVDGKDRIARFMVIMNGKHPATTYKENNHIVVEVDKTALVEKEKQVLDQMKRHSDARSTNPMVDYHYNQGRTYARLGKWEDAVDEYLKAMEMDPHNEKLRVSLNVAKQNIKSEREMEKAERQYRGGEYNEAIRSLRAIIAMWPDDIAAHFLLAKSYLKVNRYAEAVAELERVIGLNPDYENVKPLLELARRRKMLNSFSVDVKDQDVVEVLRSLLHGTGYNLIVEDGVAGRKISGRFTDFTLEQALNELIIKNGLTYEREENTIKIVPDVPDPESKVYAQANLVDLELINVLEVLSKMMQKNFILDKSLDKKLKEKITFFIKDELTIGEIFDIVVKTNDLFPVPYSDNTYIIMTREEALKQNRYVEKKFHIFKLSHIKPSVLKSQMFQLEEISKSINEKNLQADDETMTITAYESDENIGLLNKILQDLDIKKRQVTIAVKMLEVSRTAKRVLGLNLVNNLNQTTLNADTPLMFGVKNLGKISNLDLDAKIEMLENDDYVRTLSSPILRVVDGEAAEIHSGRTVPVKDIQQNPQYEGGKVVGYTSTESWTEVNLGIKLTVESVKIHHNGEITLKVSIQQNDADLTNIQPGARFVTTDKSQNTTLTLRDGDTIVMGGLISTQHGKNHKRVPFFNRIPVIGRLFANKNDEKFRSELIIFMTGFIVNKDDMEVVKEEQVLKNAIGKYEY